MTVAFVGHRKIETSTDLKLKLYNIIEHLIIDEGAETFLFGSRSEFNDLCYTVVSELHVKYRQIKRIYVRAEYEYVNSDYTEYLLTMYEDTFYSPRVHGAGALSYIKRNEVMIDSCDVLIVYCNVNYMPIKTRSGTKIAVEYAQKHGKRIFNLY